MKRVLFIIIAIIVITGIIFLVRGRTSTSGIKEKEYIVSTGTIKVPLTLSGEIRAKEQTTVRFATAGKIASIKVQEGNTIKKGQTLASLDQRELQNSMQKLLNTYLTNRWTFEQTKSDNQTTAEVHASQLVRERAQRIIDQAQFSLNNAVLDVEAKALSLEFSQLTSPINGIVTKAPQLAVGTNITTPTQAEFVVVNPTSLYFEALADQTEITSLRVGQQADISFDSFPDSTVSANLSTIAFSPKEGEVGTVYAVEITLPSIRDDFRLGMTGDVTFTTSEKTNVILVPLSFVTSKDGKQIVKVKGNSKIVEREVKLGLENDTDVEILSGLSSGEVIYD